MLLPSWNIHPPPLHFQSLETAKDISTRGTWIAQPALPQQINRDIINIKRCRDRRAFCLPGTLLAPLLL